MTQQRERRMFRGTVELREGKGGKPMITGYAAVFNRLSKNLGYFVEDIAPGAFTKTLRESDPVGLMNHDPNLLLGRMSAGTLRCSEDGTGLPYEIDPPDTTAGRDTVTSLERGDLAGSSFSFGVIDDDWGLSPEGFPKRTLLEVGPLYDVGPVTFPAYPDTTSGVRALELLAERRHVAVEEVMQAARSGKLPVLITGKASDALDVPAGRGLKLTPATVQRFTQLLAEVRAGKALSSANTQFLNDLLSKLADIDSHLDEADVAIDDALEALSSFLDVDNPDPADKPDSDPLSVPGRSLTLQRRRLELAALQYSTAG